MFLIDVTFMLPLRKLCFTDISVAEVLKQSTSRCAPHAASTERSKCGVC